MTKNIISCIFCKCQLPSGGGTQDKYVEHLQGWHMMTVAEEVARALQITSAPQEVANLTHSSASKSAAPSYTPPSPISSPGTVTVQRSPAFSLTSQSFSNSSEVKVEESCFENVTTIGGDSKVKTEKKKNLVKLLRRPRDAHSETTVTCTDCGIQLHWASLANHRKRHHTGEEPTEIGVLNSNGGVNNGEVGEKKHQVKEMGGETTEQNRKNCTRPKNIVSCAECGISLLDRSLERHRKRFHPKGKLGEKVLTGESEDHSIIQPKQKYEEVRWELKNDEVLPHSEESKVRCDECGKDFSKNSLYFHKKTIHRREKMQCKVLGCEKTFTRYHIREDHIRKVHGGSMLRCKYEGCTSQFYSKNGLRRHHLTHQ